MSLSELIIIFIVAIIVFGPNKLPMLARHLGLLMAKLNQLKMQWAAFWDSQLNEAQLLDNERKAQKADEAYLKHSEGKPQNKPLD